jgi:hypothetical protein
VTLSFGLDNPEYEWDGVIPEQVETLEENGAPDEYKEVDTKHALKALVIDELEFVNFGNYPKSHVKALMLSAVGSFYILTSFFKPKRDLVRKAIILLNFNERIFPFRLIEISHSIIWSMKLVVSASSPPRDIKQ